MTVYETTGFAHLRAALRGEVAALRSAPEGGRDQTAYKSATRLGELVTGAGLDFNFASEALVEISEGWDPAESAMEPALLLNLRHAAEVWALGADDGIPRDAVSRIAGRLILHLPTLHNPAQTWGLE